MNNILFNITNPNDVAKQIASRVKARRLELNLSQEDMSSKAGVMFATYSTLIRPVRIHYEDCFKNEEFEIIVETLSPWHL